MPEIICPKCGGKDCLVAAYKEHTDYIVDDVNAESGDFDIEYSSAHAYDTELIHIACNACDKYWYNADEFAVEVRQSKFYKKPKKKVVTKTKK